MIPEVRLELLRPILRLLDPASDLIMCFYWTRRVTRVLERICGRFQGRLSGFPLVRLGMLGQILGAPVVIA